MGHIKEPPGVDFVVESKPPTEIDQKMISEAIALYKKTGKKMRTTLKSPKKRAGKIATRDKSIST